MPSEKFGSFLPSSFTFLFLNSSLSFVSFTPPKREVMFDAIVVSYVTNVVVCAFLLDCITSLDIDVCLEDSEFS